MKKRGRYLAKCSIEEQLPCGAGEQIAPTHYLGDPHRSVIDHTRKLVARHTLWPPNNKVPKVNTRHEFLWTAFAIDKLDTLAVLDVKTPRHLRRRSTGIRQPPIWATGAWINGFIISIVRCVEGFEDVLA